MIVHKSIKLAYAPFQSQIAVSIFPFSKKAMVFSENSVKVDILKGFPVATARPRLTTIAYNSKQKSLITQDVIHMSKMKIAIQYQINSVVTPASFMLLRL